MATNASLASKIGEKWANVRHAFHMVDVDRKGIDRSEFHFLIRNELNIPGSDEDLNALFVAFDSRNAGRVTYDMFNKQVAHIVQEMEGNGGKSNNREIDRKVVPHGRIHNLPDTVLWNNRWRQEVCTPTLSFSNAATPNNSNNNNISNNNNNSMDVYAEDAPRIKRLLEGDYFFLHGSALNGGASTFRRPGTAASSTIGGGRAAATARTQEWDYTYQVPKVQSLMNGMYYGDDTVTGAGARKKTAANDAVVRNRRLAATYSTMLARSRPIVPNYGEEGYNNYEAARATSSNSSWRMWPPPPQPQPQPQPQTTTATTNGNSASGSSTHRGIFTPRSSTATTNNNNDGWGENSYLNNASSKRKNHHHYHHTFISPRYRAPPSAHLTSVSCRTPTDVPSMERLVGCPLDPEAANSALEWLATASPADRKKFKCLAPFLKDNMRTSVARLANQSGLAEHTQSQQAQQPSSTTTVRPATAPSSARPSAVHVRSNSNNNGSSVVDSTAAAPPPPPAAPMVPKPPTASRSSNTGTASLQGTAAATTSTGGGGGRRFITAGVLPVNLNQAWQRVSYGCSWASPRLEVSAA